MFFFFAMFYTCFKQLIKKYGISFWGGRDVFYILKKNSTPIITVVFVYTVNYIIHLGIISRKKLQYNYCYYLLLVKWSANDS